MEEPFPGHTNKSSPMHVFLPQMILEEVLSFPTLLPFHPTAMGAGESLFWKETKQAHYVVYMFHEAQPKVPVKLFIMLVFCLGV